MSNLTIEAVPDELVALTTTPEGMALAIAAVLDAFGMGDEQLDEETLAGLRRGLADIAAGRTYSFEEAYTEGREELIARMKASKHDDGRRSESPGSIHRAA
ncbi:hypothetical protein [Armatimonas sp.]|uniref:hypothetical protein n=1 Tax=Armatimonas sp. TaxID=1872638 RepID=UPI003751E33F